MRAAKFGFALLLATSSTGLFALTGCGSAPETPAQAANMADDADNTLRKMERTTPELQPTVDGAAGYAVLDVTTGGFGIGGTSGKGTVWKKGHQYLGTTNLSAFKAGLLAGGATYQELIVFQDDDALNRFCTSNGLKFDANASAVALKAGTAVVPKFQQGIAVFLSGEEGLQFDASIGGQQFTFTSANPVAPATRPTAPMAQPTTAPALGQ